MITLEMIKAEIAILEKMLRNQEYIISKLESEIERFEQTYIIANLNDELWNAYNEKWETLKAHKAQADIKERRIYALKELADTYRE